MIKLDELMSKLNAKKSKNQSIVFAVFQPDAIYFSSSDTHLELPSRYPLSDKSLAVSLASALSMAGIKNVLVDVILHVNQYQSFQIDKPAIPKSEWQAALPFLLKDLIREKVTDVVADAYELPNSNKVQSYVVHKKLILELYHQLHEQHCELHRVVPEQEVWAQSVQDLSHFLLLQKSTEGSFKLEAFYQQRCTFQRTLRGVVSPLTGSSSSPLQLDGLALELQRSVDYLSSQMKGVPLHVLKVCCDEENNEEVVAALNERLSVKSSVLDAEHDSSGLVLARSAHKVQSGAINFFQSQLKPKVDHFTLTNVAAVWGAILVVMLLITAFYQYELAQKSKYLLTLQSQQTMLVAQRDELKKQAANHQPSPDKLAAISRLKKEIDAKNASIGAVDSIEQSKQAGYSGIMSGLAKLANTDIALSEIEIDNNQLNIKGYARNAASVPAWIAQFKQELHLIGRSFEKLKIERDDKGVVTFELKTKQEAK
ncbi:PilN domain-containing protein [Vibrio porteresiae]|uniref:MSHA biogenesis protein MshI n=1 Tax=Vibrio porteresiae DSM 19223 TaxID=1123496 RepID=A0ABZ0QEK4_9VIBR|nr:PilN domain-containing protein [Vibrio porteresiae]WPC74436.1 MSHA biogenesis protein MshI [Vibrio porteresiae DSM 19223]